MCWSYLRFELAPSTRRNLQSRLPTGLLATFETLPVTAVPANRGGKALKQPYRCVPSDEISSVQGQFTFRGRRSAAMRMSLLAPATLASAAGAQVTPRTPINVVGHAWAPFISPMGEPFRAHTKADNTLAMWFSQADRNGDGA